ncbi:ABC transporter substrate-binding protein [Streptomyces millisiae]|uniref:Extracellular solute-binding protein n=1 Tax=Streptomyces millisiae TaxID=3075542 RepID=A0ABU2LM26_9ACTN|nr:extracellular solute-binding protein [Streptomyces sp. DSM 44918]MDT0318644.1 extracellular solute-binding protein [Streptomyces sp. DSM 44918]
MFRIRPGSGPRPAPARGPSRRAVLRGATAAGALVAAGGALGGCSGPDADAAARPVPGYYPTDYATLVDGSRRELKLVIYSQTSQTVWQPIFDAFADRYPWLTDVRATNLGNSAVYERYYSEAAIGTSPADLLVSNGPGNWADYATRGLAADYVSPEKSRLPEFAELLPGVWAFSVDPVVILYNRRTLDEARRPRGLAHLGELCEAEPARFRGKIGAYDPSNAFGYATNHGYTGSVPGGWENMARVLPFARAEHSSGTLVEKVVSGEYDASINISGATAVSAAKRSGGLLGWTYCEEGTVLVPRAASIVSTAPHPNAARLFLDFLLSADGQAAAAAGVLTPYRPDVEQSDVDSLQDVRRLLGADRVHIHPYDPVDEADQESYLHRWEQAMG